MNTVSCSERRDKRVGRTLLTLFVFLLATPCLHGQSPGTKDAAITSVEGESWLRHLRRPFNESSMGRTWDLGPPPLRPGEGFPRWDLELSPGYATQSVTLHGSDLYRLNCRGCHGESGGGSPPEVNSVINPVRATSVAVILGRAKQMGQDMSRADATVLAGQAKALLMERFHKGGESMPAFPYLREPEIHSIVAYLELLSAVPGAERNQIAVRESPYAVGQHIAKSLCHICHSASGPNPNPQQIMEGAIPPLSTLTARTTMYEFVRKVTNGATILMGDGPLSFRDHYRGRMPVFRFLSEDEAADVYLYLLLYPPTERQ